ncbi:hypothetical protein A6R68_11785, partial [Neotoma lepida]
MNWPVSLLCRRNFMMRLTDFCPIKSTRLDPPPSGTIHQPVWTDCNCPSHELHIQKK